jgi:hypothetical protein
VNLFTQIRITSEAIISKDVALSPPWSNCSFEFLMGDRHLNNYSQNKNQPACGAGNSSLLVISGVEKSELCL